MHSQTGSLLSFLDSQFSNPQSGHKIASGALSGACFKVTQTNMGFCNNF